MNAYTDLLFLCCLFAVGRTFGQTSTEQTFSVQEGQPNVIIGTIGEGLSADFQPPYNLLIDQQEVSLALSINHLTGVITTNGSLDREQSDTYSFVVVTSSSAFIRVTVHVEDINDNKPVFRNSTLLIQLSENSPPNVKISLVSAVDYDLEPYGINTFEIVGGNINNAFKLSRSKSSGNNVLHLDLMVVGSLNYAITPFYSLLVRVYDGGGLFGDLRVNISIIDTNNNEPIFNQSKYSTTVWENATVGTSIVEVFATDADSGENGKIRYSISHQEGDPEYNFRIDAVTGVISINKPLDFETKSVFELTVTATDNGSKSLSVSIGVEVRVLNINEQPADINLVFLSTGNQTGHISENASIGEFVARLSVSDPDTPGEYYSNVTVTLQGGLGFFGLTSQDSVVYLVLVDRPLDRETTPYYNFTVIAVDSGMPPLHASRSFTLFVDDVNDNAPVFTQQTYTASVQEIVPAGSPIIQVTASDADIGENARLTYSILNTPATHSNWFTVEPRTGLVTTQGQIDCETNSKPQIIVVATDSGHPPLSSTATVSVTVVDVNDNQPVFEQSFYSATVKEDANVGHCILQVSAIDPDCGKNAQIFYYLPNTTSQTMDVFKMLPETGQLCVQQPLDYEQHQQYEFPVMARDSGISPSVAIVMITVLDVNDISPKFYPQSYSVNVNLNAAPDTYVVTVQATDDDSGIFGQVQYSISNGNGAGIFKINSDNGVITLAKSIPPGEHVYTLLLKARDGGGLMSENAAEVLVSVTGPNHNPPAFDESSYHFSVEENVSEQFVIGTVHATVNGTSDTGIQYSITSGDQNSYFSINQYTGQVYTAAPLDHDTHPSLLLNIKGQMGSPPVYGTTQVNITVQDVNDNAPFFAYRHLEISVKEDVGNTEKVFVVQATDIDSGLNGSIRYSLLKNPQSLFRIDPLNGEVYLDDELDYESRKQYNLIISAADQGSPFAKSSSMTVLIEVQDVNDNIPIFSRNNYYAEVIETAYVNTNFFQVNASDRDSGNNGRITFSLLNRPNTKFGIFPVDGILYVNETLDREEQDTYTLVVQASDNGQPLLSSTASIQISILDANDNIPTFSKSAYHFTMVESQPRGSTVGYISASDKDFGSNGLLKYSFIDDYTEFIVNPHSGEITTIHGLDRELHTKYEIRVRASDQGTTVKSSTSVVYITILDMNDNSPVFQNVQQNIAYVDENRPKDTRVMQVVATDPDLDENGTISYFIDRAGGSQDFFSIHSKTGWITTREVLDFETKRQYVLTVIAKDNGTPFRETRTDIQIFVQDDNDETPVFPDHKVTFNVVENTPVGTIVGRVQAYDGDSGENGRVSYYIIGGNVFGIFAVNTTTGNIYSIRSIDYEESSSHSVGIKAIDNSVYSPLSSTTRVEIKVIDVNDNPPLFDRDPVVLRIRENTPLGYSVYLFAASDKDSGLNGTVGYAVLNESSDMSYFNLEPQTGELKVAAIIDYEQVHEISLIVQAHDLSQYPAHRLNATLTVVIFITDENDNSPIFKSYTSVAVLEDELVGYPLMCIVAIDDDSNINNSGNNVVIFSVVSGNEDQIFSLDEQSGLLTIAKSLDREVEDRFLLNISACDQGSPQHSSYMVLTIEVVDINDNIPNFDQLSYRANVLEEQEAGAMVTTVHATDGDTGENGKLTYFIPQGIAEDKFTVNSSSGHVTTTHVLDREKKSSYNITVYVKDGGYPTQYHMTVIIVDVADKNDHVPVFKDAEYLLQVPENTGRIVIHTFVAHDADSGLNGQVVYRISAGDPMRQFSIDRSTGQLSCATLDRETVSEYELTIIAQDQGVPQYSTQCTAIIMILDQNDNKPVFESQHYTKSLLENTKVGDVVLQVTATDADIGRNGIVTYSLGNDTAGLFQINSTSGIIITTGTFDREKKSTYSIEVIAKDGGVNSLVTSAVAVHITIEDVNDNPPVFQNVPYMKSIVHNTGLNSLVLTVHAEDKDVGENARVSYNFGIGTTSLALDIFRLESDTGNILTMGNLNNAVGYHNLQIIASDNGQPQLSSTGIVTIVVGGSPDSLELQFDSVVYVVEKQEHPQLNTPVTRVTAHYTNSQTTSITYNFASGNDDRAFNINSATGIITVNNPDILDYETEPQRQLIVMATGSSAFGYCTVLVNLQDINDNKPKFTQDSYVSATWEEMPPVTYVTQVMATDADEGQNGEILYKIISGDDDHVFDIYPPDSGLVVTSNILDYHTRHFYHLQIEAKDQGDLQHSSTCVLNITVVDTNNQKPYFRQPNPVNVSEALEVGSVIAWVTATDVDENPPLAYGFEQHGDHDRTFSIDPFSGLITLAKPLDSETRQQYDLRIMANDSIHTTVTTMMVFVEDENDNPPIFSQQNYQVTIKELSPPDSYVVTVNATDADQGRNAIIFYRLGSPTSQNFYINYITGSIFTNNTIHYRADQQMVQLSVIAEDDGSPVLSTVVSVHIQIARINQFPPEFTISSYSVLVPEDSERGISILQVNALDQDSEGRSDVDYRIVDGNVQNAFNIDRKSGQVSLNVDLDREILSLYTLLVLAEDRGIPSMSSTASVIITVEDVNDQAPYFQQEEYYVELSENLPSETTFLNVTALDNDFDINAQIHYIITSGNDDGLFIVNGNTGEVVITPNAFLDYEKHSSHKLIVRAMDCSECSNTVQRLSAFATIFVNVSDINEFIPTFPVPLYTEGVDENQPTNTRVFQAHANDKDGGYYGIVEYSIISSLFTINRETGWVYTNATFNFESPVNFYQFQITAQDFGGFQSQISVIVNVKDEDEFQPKFAKSVYIFEVLGNFKVGKIVGFIDATDDDGGDTGRLVYKLNPPHNYFDIDPAIGVLTIIKDLNQPIMLRNKRNAKKLSRHKRAASNDIEKLTVVVSSGLENSHLDSVVINISIDRSCDGCAMNLPATPEKSSTEDWVIVIIVVGIIIVIIVVIVGIYCARTRFFKIQESTVSEVFDGSFDETYAPPHLKNGNIHGFGNHLDSSIHSGTQILSDLSNRSHNSNSSGRGSAEEEDEEIKMINSNELSSYLNQSNGLRGNVMPDSGIQADVSSEPSTHQEYLARLGIDSTKIKFKQKVGIQCSVESMHQFSDEGGGEATDLDIGNVDYGKLNERDTDSEVTMIDKNKDQGFHEPEPQHNGSLSSVINNEEEYSGSYNWDYLLDWGPQYQPLAHVFAEIARLKDDNIQPRKHPVQTIPQRVNNTNLNTRVRTLPPPMITNAPPRHIENASLNMSSHSNSQRMGARTASTMNTSLLSLPRSPISYESSFTSPALTPSFTPSLSPLATRSPSVSPVASAKGFGSSVPSSGQNTPRTVHYLTNGKLDFHATHGSEKELQI